MDTGARTASILHLSDVSAREHHSNEHTSHCLYYINLSAAQIPGTCGAGLSGLTCSTWFGVQFRVCLFVKANFTSCCMPRPIPHRRIHKRDTLFVTTSRYPGFRYAPFLSCVLRSLQQCPCIHHYWTKPSKAQWKLQYITYYDSDRIC